MFSIVFALPIWTTCLLARAAALLQRHKAMSWPCSRGAPAAGCFCCLALFLLFRLLRFPSRAPSGFARALWFCFALRALLALLSLLLVAPPFPVWSPSCLLAAALLRCLGSSLRVVKQPSALLRSAAIVRTSSAHVPGFAAASELAGVACVVVCARARRLYAVSKGALATLGGAATLESACAPALPPAPWMTTSTGATTA